MSFRATLQRGVDMLSEIIDHNDVSADDAFFLHDSLGFPIDLTLEVAEEAGLTVDRAAFDALSGPGSTKIPRCPRRRPRSSRSR